MSGRLRPRPALPAREHRELGRVTLYRDDVEDLLAILQEHTTRLLRVTAADHELTHIDDIARLPHPIDMTITTLGPLVILALGPERAHVTAIPADDAEVDAGRRVVDEVYRRTGLRRTERAGWRDLRPSAIYGGVQVAALAVLVLLQVLPALTILGGLAGATAASAGSAWWLRAHPGLIRSSARVLTASSEERPPVAPRDWPSLVTSAAAVLTAGATAATVWLRQ